VDVKAHPERSRERVGRLKNASGEPSKKGRLY
jgi:hypothetical protein